MTLLRPLWQQVTTAEGGYPARADRRLIAASLTEGIIGLLDLKVTQRGAGANYSVDVSAGDAAITGDANAGQGRYLVSSTAVENLVPTPVPSPGNQRIDVVIAELRDHTEDASTFKDWRLRIVAGAPSGSPAVPATPASAIALARILIDDSTTSIVNADITDVRTFTRPATQRFEKNYETTDLTATFVAPIMELGVPAQGYPYEAYVEAFFHYSVGTGTTVEDVEGVLYDSSNPGAVLRGASESTLAIAGGQLTKNCYLPPYKFTVSDGAALDVEVWALRVGTPGIALIDDVDLQYLRARVVPTG